MIGCYENKKYSISSSYPKGESNLVSLEFLGMQARILPISLKENLLLPEEILDPTLMAIEVFYELSRIAYVHRDR